MDKETSASASASSSSKSKRTRKISHTATARTATIGKKKTIPELDEEFEVVGSKTTSSVIRPRSTASKTQRKQAPINRPRVLVSSKIRKQGDNFKITREYSDGTKENEVIITDENKEVKLVFQKHKALRSERGWPGVEITKYFSDGRIEKTKDWKYNKEWR